MRGLARGKTSSLCGTIIDHPRSPSITRFRAIHTIPQMNLLIVSISPSRCHVAQLLNHPHITFILIIMPDIAATFSDDDPPAFDNCRKGTPNTDTSAETPDQPSSTSISLSSLADVVYDQLTETKPPITSTTLTLPRRRAVPASRNGNIFRDVEVSEEEIVTLSRQIRDTNFMFAPNTRSVRGGWDYQVIALVLEGDPFTFNPAGGDYRMKERVCTFRCDPFQQHYFTRDSNSWIQHNMTILGDTVPKSMIAKQHTEWTSRPNLARSHALERVKSNLYVADLLKVFVQDLENVSKSKRGQTARIAAEDMHMQSCNLKVPPNSLLKTFGRTLSDESEWLLIDAPHDSDNVRYLHPYKFRCDHEDKWSNLVHALAHFAYHRTGALSLLSQIDCDKSGNLSNLICFTRGYPHVGIPGTDMDEEVHMAFVHFKGEHKCNPICRTLGLYNVQTGYPANRSD
ncbi:uncharacterized protein MELLADRAFT_59902 [Melampsora larici-populina 98AG31]|uniref:Alpha-type protein kinase domain-containing protein n=1 Tax=Melampsora larici-populina (strain 98AG31 / pathotype 3-4-7) TaxID=747676 RepID=F4R978_MELLP|nr:uncharacterized protein MELLADRAFT_59902 [Melampsora larici-populina 98AG31]EGG10936.1 hypothetical protein MELLADRAFT_59902 [Melampsora larici-populina 98AG31]